MANSGQKTVTPDQLLKRVVEFYAASHDANGLPVRVILNEGIPLQALTDLVTALVNADQLEVVFSETDENPHIRRFPKWMRKPFSDLLDTCRLENACLYPSELVTDQPIDLSRLADMPYALRLWRGAGHLDLVFFDLAVLEQYRNDPRYRFSQDFFGGSLSIKDQHYENMPERDNVFIQRFGIGFDADGHRVLCVILRNLCDLSPKHQRIWREHERADQCKLNEASLEAWFFGAWSEFGSIFEAIIEELRAINQMCEQAFSKRLFKNEFADPPRAYGVLLRPTQKEFNDFARALDVMLSENIDRDFFPAWISRTKTVVQKDGSERVEDKGSITLLKEWIELSFRVTQGSPAHEITAPLRHVRKLRSKPSHADVPDEFDTSFEEKQRAVLLEAYTAVRTLRLILANHADAKSVAIPDWLYSGQIRIP